MKPQQRDNGARAVTTLRPVTYSCGGLGCPPKLRRCKTRWTGVRSHESIESSLLRLRWKQKFYDSKWRCQQKIRVRIVCRDRCLSSHEGITDSCSPRAIDLNRRNARWSLVAASVVTLALTVAIHSTSMMFSTRLSPVRGRAAPVRRRRCPAGTCPHRPRNRRGLARTAPRWCAAAQSASTNTIRRRSADENSRSTCSGGSPRLQLPRRSHRDSGRRAHPTNTPRRRSAQTSMYLLDDSFPSSVECPRQPEIHRHRRPHGRQRLRRQRIPATVFTPPAVGRQILGELASIHPSALDHLEPANVAIRQLADERVDERRREICLAVPETHRVRQYSAHRFAQQVFSAAAAQEKAARRAQEILGQ